MDIDELLEQFKALSVWHKGVTAVAVIMLAAMLIMIVWGIIAWEMRLLLILAGVIFGICGAGLYFIVHSLYNKTKKVFEDYFEASKMPEDEIKALLDKHGIKSI